MIIYILSTSEPCENEMTVVVLERNNIADMKICMPHHYGVITWGDPSKNVFYCVQGVYNNFEIFKII